MPTTTTMIRRDLALALAVATSLSLACGPPRVDAPVDRATTLRELTSSPGTENNPRVSPDGRTLAFGVGSGDASRIILMNLVDGSMDTLRTGPGNAYRPAWSPDGERLAFVSGRGGSTGLWIAPGTGGDATRLFDAGRTRLSELDWSPDGRRIATTRIDPAGQGNVSYGRATVITIDVEDGTVAEITTGGDEWVPRWLGDGASLVYYVGRNDDLRIVNTATREVRPLGRPGLIGWRPAVNSVGTRVAYVSDVAGYGLWVATVAEPTAAVRLVAGGPESPAFFPDGRHIAFTLDTTSSWVVSIDLATGRHDTLATGIAPKTLPAGGVAFLPDGTRSNRIITMRNGRADTLSLSLDHIVDFWYSPDGERFVVSAPGVMDARHDAYLFTRDGSQDRRLTHSGDVLSATWCDDSRTLLYSSRSGKDINRFRTIWSIDTRTGRSSPLTTDPSWNQRPTHCDRDGTRVTFEHYVNAGGQFVLSRRDGSTRSVGDGSQGRWSPDGSRMAYVAGRGGQTDVYIREPDGSETRVTNDAGVERGPRWSDDDTRLVFGVRTPNRNIWSATVPPPAGSETHPEDTTATNDGEI